MSATGTYVEDLPCGGRLKVSKSSWEISYYFPGPDARHNGTSVTLPGDRIKEYINAFENNWTEYKRLKGMIPSEGSFSKEGQKGMTIRLGMFEGVCLRGHHMPVSSRERLTKIINSYEYAAKRSRQVQSFLAKMDESPE